MSLDLATLTAFKSRWGTEQRPTGRDLPRFASDEGALDDDLRDNRIRKNLRLEQERIGFGWVEAALPALKGADRKNARRAVGHAARAARCTGFCEACLRSSSCGHGVTVKVAHSAVQISLALRERAGVRETVMAAVAYIVRVALAPWPLAP